MGGVAIITVLWEVLVCPEIEERHRLGCTGLVILKSLTFSSEFSRLRLYGAKITLWINSFSYLISSIITALSCLNLVTIWITSGLSSIS